ncbi:predicted protein [Arabidopsis lyrata subsp. lyrata]|uniref:Predicted protein n=1 Tax=Arabidopsis lyrata subsp. lyrata TaxID=81972 RepID=D7MI87_ARALL|nr:predicted protein [Arabidopsis lyrata subsp. lyrata]
MVEENVGSDGCNFQSTRDGFEDRQEKMMGRIDRIHRIQEAKVTPTNPTSGKQTRVFAFKNPNLVTCVEKKSKSNENEAKFHT